MLLIKLITNRIHIKLISVFFIFQFLLSCATHSTPKNQIVFTENSIDTSAANMACYKIETPTATYYLEKKGLGLSSLIDKEGSDWISFTPEKGTKAGGEYRGFPNAVYRQDGNFFHPLNSGTEKSTSKVISVDSEKVTIVGKSGNEAWECRWDFYKTHCTFTMTKMPANHNYWILYEGTPGGSFDDSDWWMTSAVKDKMSMIINHEGDIPSPEWIVFGDNKKSRSLFLYNHQDDNLTDSFYQMKRKMTVFGFAREGTKSFFDNVPHSFSIGFLEIDTHIGIINELDKLFQLSKN